MTRPPVIALVGRPNVGKSSLLNRIVGRAHAIVEPTPGVTRDRNYARAVWNGRTLVVVDTGGLDPEHQTPIQQAIDDQVQCALDEADGVILVGDGRDGLHPLDREIVGLLRRRFRGPVLVAANKLDNPAMEPAAAEFYSLGVETVHAVSAVHGHGVADLLDSLLAALPAGDDAAAAPESEGPRIVLAGKPNVGKSSLFNRIVGQQRSIVDDVPGTTRDTIEVSVHRNQREYRFLDTAGLRRPNRRKDNVERLSVMLTLGAIRRTDIAILLLDATENQVSEQDKRIASAIIEAQAGCIIVWNKWDLVTKDPQTWSKLIETTRRELNLLEFAPVINCSALTGLRTQKVFETLDTVIEAGQTRIPAERLRQLLFDATTIQPPPGYRGRPMRLKQLLQLPGPGILFRLTASQPEGLHFSYRRYLVNQLRREGGFEGWPIRLLVKSSPEQ